MDQVLVPAQPAGRLPLPRTPGGEAGGGAGWDGQSGCQEARPGHNGVWELGPAAVGDPDTPPCLSSQETQEQVSASTSGPPRVTGTPLFPPRPVILPQCS